MTDKQSKAMTLIPQSDSVGKAMIQAGYSVSSSKKPQRLTKSKAYGKNLAKLLKKNKVTLSKYISNIGEAMDASKTVIIGKGDDAFADNVVDHTTRLQANKQAERFLFNINEATEAKVLKIESGDEIELQRVLFKAKDV